jgi:CheY-like chemotaxis protein
MDRLFKSFSQVDASMTRRYGGTGLGLAISGRLAELMGGRIQATSEAGRGSRFCFELPVQIAVESPDPTPAAPVLDPGFARRHPLRVLVVEDNAVNRKVSIMTLHRLGYGAAAAQNGREALHHLARSTCDLILMDMQMPQMGGLETCRRIRTVAGADGPPYILALTANARQEDKAACLAVGMQDYLTKPVRTEDLMAAIMRAHAWLSGKGSIGRTGPWPQLDSSHA